MTLEICVIDTDTGLLYEWNGAHTINIYNALNYASAHRYNNAPTNVTDSKGFDMWTMAEPSKPDANDFVTSVYEHIEGDEDN